MVDRSGELVCNSPEDIMKLLKEHGLFQASRLLRVEALELLFRKMCLRVNTAFRLLRIQVLLGGGNNNSRLPSRIRAVHIEQEFFLGVDPHGWHQGAIQLAILAPAAQRMQLYNSIDANGLVLVNQLLQAATQSFRTALFAVSMPYLLLLPRNGVGNDEPTMEMSRFSHQPWHFSCDANRLLARPSIAGLLTMRSGNGLKILISLGPFFDEIEAIIFEREPQELGGSTMSLASSSALDGLMLANIHNEQTVLRWQFRKHRLNGLTLCALRF
jgi:hypothetical protein